MIVQPEVSEAKKAAHPSDWLANRALALLDPLVPRIIAQEARLDISGRASDHDARADRLESFARPFHLYALWLGHLKSESLELRPGWLKSFADCLRHGTDPNSNAYWGPATNFHQQVVEMGLFVLSLELCREEFWDALDDDCKSNVLDWLETSRSAGTHWNNHLFFAIFVLEFLGKEGRARKGDDALIEQWFRELESMYRGRGWFRDGMNDSADYYNAFAFHYYGLSWALWYRSRDRARALRWQAWARDFLKSYSLVYAEDGSVPNFGRSQTYRFATLAPYGAALLLDDCPLPYGHVRRIAENHFDYFLKGSVYAPEGWMNIGWKDELPIVAESYSCISSTYWSSKGFSLLMLPRDHAFWKAEASPANEVYSDSVEEIPEVGLTFRRFDGDTEILNSGSSVSVVNLRFFESKWSKLAYRASTGTVLPDKEMRFPEDIALVAEFDDHRLGRHTTFPLEMSRDHLLCAYTLGEKTFPEMVDVETFISWKGPWLFIHHKVKPSASCLLRQGGFPLGIPNSEQACMIQKSAMSEMTCDYLSLQMDGRITVMQNLEGFDAIEVTGRTSESETRRHTLSPFHLVPTLKCQMPKERMTLSLLLYAGTNEEEAKPWVVTKAVSGPNLKHKEFGHWNPLESITLS
ncbi:DUF2264 domain-containing protein [Rubellicoccus peritrichatus]|uniref:DUF2264 domain-containing protein n=1 Tax=Rubellicoccus peritrichatus TaxID=3080537 RepID=A0AAQ3L9M7_9BACT|nr:DUF2264 domain-containing protein [Puniceicoccus sp. CR14]WOO41217.1 DUF2264 domain-containing protein [Puniceicoccus sp. CR14]